MTIWRHFGAKNLFQPFLRETLIALIFFNLWAYVAILDFVQIPHKRMFVLKIKSKIVKTTFSQIYPLSTDFANFSEYSVQSLFILRQIGQAGPITPPRNSSLN